RAQGRPSHGTAPGREGPAGCGRGVRGRAGRAAGRPRRSHHAGGHGGQPPGSGGGGGSGAPAGPARTLGHARRPHRTHPGQRTGQLHPCHRLHPRAARAGPVGPAAVTTRTGATGGGLLAAAGLVAGITLLARAVGLVRWVVFSHAVGATCVGQVYGTANLVPNVLFEVAAGGALAAVAVPLVAGHLHRGRADLAGRTASALLT